MDERAAELCETAVLLPPGPLVLPGLRASGSVPPPTGDEADEDEEEEPKLEKKDDAREAAEEVAEGDVTCDCEDDDEDAVDAVLAELDAGAAKLPSSVSLGVSSGLPSKAATTSHKPSSSVPTKSRSSVRR